MSGALRLGVAAASLALCLGGAAMIAAGGAVPVEARMGQAGLEREFTQRLAELSVAPAQRGKLKAAAVPAAGLARPPVPRRALPATGPVAKLTVRRLGVAEIVQAGEASHDRLASGPTVIGHGKTASPVTILAAHRDTHFRFIRDLRAGDEIGVQLVTGERQRYRVIRFETVRWDGFAYPVNAPHPLLALVTCWPFDGNEYGGPLRRIAWAEQID